MSFEPGNYEEISATLSRALHLAQSPVAVCLTDAVPDGVPSITGRAPAGCRFWQDGATSRFATTPSDHSLCAIGMYTHNLESTPAAQIDLMDSLKVFADLGYVRQQDLPLIPVLQSRPSFVIYSPLAEAPVRPDVVLLFVNADQTLILTEATQQVENEAPPALGRPACAVVPQAKNNGRAALSLGCCGARAYLDVLNDATAVFAIPGEKLEAYTERIDALANANAILSKFHVLRRQSVEAGQSPTIAESLAALQPQG